MVRVEGIPQEQKRSPIDVMLEIKREINPPLPTLPKNASERDRWNHSIAIGEAIAHWIKPSEDHPRYIEYQRAMQEYLGWFRESTI